MTDKISIVNASNYQIFPGDTTGSMMVEDEFQPDGDEDPLSQKRKKGSYSKAKKIKTGSDSELKDRDSLEEKVIHIDTRSVTSKPTVSGLSASSILKNSRQNVSLATVFLCPDQNCKLKLPSRATLLTHFKMCHTKEITAEEEEEEAGNLADQTLDPLDFGSDPDDPEVVGRQGGKGRKDHICTECGHIAETSISHKKHMKTCHDEVKTYNCPDCGVKVSRKYHLLRHIKAVHEKAKFWQCDSCDYKTNNQACFKKHKQSKHDGGGDCDIRYSLEYLQNLPPGVKEEDLNCVCTWCAFRSNKYSIVKKHIEIHHERKKHYSCKECLFVGQSVDDYAEHYHAFHKTDSYPHACTDCSFRCTNKHDLKTHYVEVHSKQRMYVCKSCNHKSNDVNNMKRHILTVHPTIYKCDYCDYESEKKEDLFSHQYNDHGLHIINAEDMNAEDMKVVIINDEEHDIV